MTVHLLRIGLVEMLSDAPYGSSSVHPDRQYRALVAQTGSSGSVGPPRLRDDAMTTDVDRHAAPAVRERPIRSRCRGWTRSCSRSATPARPRTGTPRPSACSCVAYRGPEQGDRDHATYVLRSGSARFVLVGPVHAGAAGRRAGRRARRRGDGPGHRGARRAHGVRVRRRPRRHRGSASRTRSPTSTAPWCSPRSRRTATPGTPSSTARATRPVPARLRRAHLDASAATAARSGTSRRWTTASATSSSAGWTSGSSSTPGSWASRTWPSSSATTSRPSTPR